MAPVFERVGVLGSAPQKPWLEPPPARRAEIRMHGTMAESAVPRALLAPAPNRGSLCLGRAFGALRLL